VAVEKVTQRRVIDRLAFISPRLAFAARRMKDVEDSQRLGEMRGQGPEHGGIAARHADHQPASPRISGRHDLANKSRGVGVLHHFPIDFVSKLVHHALEDSRQGYRAA
jgi:hypothetical protein